MVTQVDFLRNTGTQGVNDLILNNIVFSREQVVHCKNSSTYYLDYCSYLPGNTNTCTYIYIGRMY